MSNAKWKLGLPKKPGKYLFAQSLYDGGYKILDAEIKSGQDLIDLIDDNLGIVAYRNWPSINQDTIDRLLKHKYRKHPEMLKYL